MPSRTLWTDPPIQIGLNQFGAKFFQSRAPKTVFDGVRRPAFEPCADAMKLPLSQTIVFKLSLSHAPIPGTNPLTYAAAHGPNYLVYDDHRDAPPGFAVRVGKKASIYLVDKLVARKKLKIPVGLASGKKDMTSPCR